LINRSACRYAEAVKKEMEVQEKIAQKLKAMEARVLHGGEDMVEKMSHVKKLAKETKAELDAKRYAHVPIRTCIVSAGFALCTLCIPSVPSHRRADGVF
jgi:hypothetical protein